MKNGVYGIVMVALTAGCGCIYVGGCGWENGKEEARRIQEIDGSMIGLSGFEARTENGSIALQGGDTNRCEVTAEITARSFTVEEAQSLAAATEVSLVQDGGRMKAVVREPQLRRGERVSVSFDVTVPRQTAAELHSTNGTISATDLDAAGGGVICHTTNGDVNLRMVTAGRMDLQSTNGTIRGEEIAGDLKASTTNGDVNAFFSPGARIKEAGLLTTNGSIRLRVPQNASARVDASTSNGSIHTDLPLTVTGKIDKSVKGTIGSGEGRLSMRTTNGSITISRAAANR